MFGLSGSEVFQFLGVALASLILPIIGIVSAALLPESAWTAAGRNKAVWLVLQIVFALLCLPVGAIFSLVYLLAIHPRVKAHSPASRSTGE